MASISAARRRKLPKSDFALPGEGEGPDGKGSGSYPIDTEARARNALSRAAQNASPEDEAKIKRAVKRKYPGIEQGSGMLTALGQRTLAGFQQKYGTGDGHQKFEQAMSRGTIDRTKMER